LVLLVFAAAVFARRTVQWGATPDEQAMRMPGDPYLAEDAAARVAMTRAVSIAAPPDTVWLWPGAPAPLITAESPRALGGASHPLSWPAPRLRRTVTLARARAARAGAQIRQEGGPR
jgi:hypothetical protein